MPIHGARLQARASLCCRNQKVTAVTVQHSTDDSVWSDVDGGATFADASGSFDALFTAPIVAQFVRITVVSWSVHISMRAGLLSLSPPPPLSPPPAPAPPLSLLLKLSAVATLSSVLDARKFPALKCIDGNVETFCHSHPDVLSSPSLTLDLGAVAHVAYIAVYNRHGDLGRKDSCRHCRARLGDYTVAYRVAPGDPWAICARATAEPTALGPLLSECSQLAQYVKVELPGSTPPVGSTDDGRILNLAEVEVYSFPSPPPPPPPPPPPSPPPPSSPVPRCETAGVLLAGATCTQSNLDPYWGGGSTACGALVDGAVRWNSHSGRHISPSGTVTISWDSVRLVASPGSPNPNSKPYPDPKPLTRLVEEIAVYQLRDHGNGKSASFAGFDLLVQSPITSTWETVLAQKSWSQNETTTPGLTQNGHDPWLALPVPMLTKSVRFEGKRSHGDWFRIEEIGVTGCLPRCDATIGLTAAASCTQSEVDPIWGRGSVDCSSLIDGNSAWGSTTSRHVYPSGSVTLAWPSPVLVETIAVYQRHTGRWSTSRPQAGFELQAYRMLLGLGGAQLCSVPKSSIGLVTFFTYALAFSRRCRA